MTEKRTISRRNFFKGAAIGAVGVGAGSLTLAGCSNDTAQSGGQGDAATSGGQSSENNTAVQTVTTTLNPQDYDYTSNSISDFSTTTLFSDWELGPLTLHHRMVKSAAFQLAFLTNNPEEFVNYYKRMADGGVEMIWAEDFANMWDFTASPLKHDWADIDVKSLVDAIHDSGAYIGYQFDTMGSAIGPLDWESNFLGDYTTDDVKGWIQTIIGIGKTLHDAGFDAFELNFAANNVGQSFFSRARNNRTDEYGPQSIESRCKFAVECIQGIKETCGEDFVVQVLINGIETDDRTLGNDALYNSVEETVAIAQAMEAAGADSLHVRLGPAGQHVAQFANDLYFTAQGLEGTNGYGNRFDFSRHYQGKLRANHSGCGMMIDIAGEIKDAVSIPVGAATYMDPAHAPDYFEEALAEGKLDFLVMNRPLCVDPEYVNKVREGRLDEIAPCTRCLHCFYDSDKDSVLMEHCRVNAANWRAYGPLMPEGFDPTPADSPKKVMVVGGGPAGMEAARIAAERGHTVTLYEKGSNLGGLLPGAEAIKGPHENLGALNAYLTRQQEVKGVTVVTGQEVDAAFIEQEAPDTVILAVGGLREEPSFTSTGATEVLTFEEAVAANMGEKVTILGSNCQAVDMAVYLLGHDKAVTIVTPDPEELFEKGHSVNVRHFIEPAIMARGCRIWPSAELVSVDDGSITFMSEADISITIDCDAVVYMRDMVPNTALVEEVSGIEIIPVGDCSSPYNIAYAISSGNLTARAV